MCYLNFILFKYSGSHNFQTELRDTMRFGQGSECFLWLKRSSHLGTGWKKSFPLPLFISLGSFEKKPVCKVMGEKRKWIGSRTTSCHGHYRGLIYRHLTVTRCQRTFGRLSNCCPYSFSIIARCIFARETLASQTIGLMVFSTDRMKDKQLQMDI